jgi:hypothetical protein
MSVLDFNLNFEFIFFNITSEEYDVSNKCKLFLFPVKQTEFSWN